MSTENMTNEEKNFKKFSEKLLKYLEELKRYCDTHVGLDRSMAWNIVFFIETCIVNDDRYSEAKRKKISILYNLLEFVNRTLKIDEKRYTLLATVDDIIAHIIRYDYGLDMYDLSGLL